VDSDASLGQERVSWGGILVPIVTPFLQDGAFDLDGLVQNVESLIGRGVDGLCVAGSTGEWFSLGERERKTLFELVASTARGRLLLLAGTSSVNIAETVALGSYARELGYDGQLLLPPPYILPTAKEVIWFFNLVAERTRLPIMAYNNPSRTGVHLDAAILKRLAEIEQVVAVKDSGNQVSQAALAIREVGGRLAYFSGSEPHATSLLLRGARGLVANLANVDPSFAVRLWRAYQDGDVSSMRAAQEKLDQLFEIVYLSGLSPYPAIKAAMKAVGHCGGYPRPPLIPLSEEESLAIAQAVRAWSSGHEGQTAIEH
jgi:4-hydroxy-tetrahydrodipicolinate synthase